MLVRKYGKVTVVMTQRMADKLNSGRKLLLVAIGIGAITGLLVFGFVNASLLHAQSPAPDWQTAAGGKMAFDVASVKQNTVPPGPGVEHTNIPLDSQDSFTATGGFFSAVHYSLATYMTFAYKLTPSKSGEVQHQLPKWAVGHAYDIEARAAGNPTKDQYRLMMQSLLADRFKMAIHYETKQLPVLALVLDKPGKLGPKLQRHPGDVPCATTIPVGGMPVSTVTGGFPGSCGAFHQLVPATPSHLAGGARNVPISVIAESLTQFIGDPKPVVDRTGLTGNYDFLIDFTLMVNHEPLDPNAPTFLEALKDQLGLKLDSKTGPVDVIVLDHVEEPSAN